MMGRRLGQVGKRLFVAWQRLEGAVRSAVPDDGKHRLAPFAMLLEERDGFAYDDLRRIAAKRFELPSAAHQRIHIKEVRHREPFVEPEHPGIPRIVAENRHTGPSMPVEVPFAEVAGHVARLPQGLGDGLLLKSQRVAVAEHTAAIVGAPGEHRCPRRRTDRPADVEPIEAKPVGRHGVEVRRSQRRVIAIAGLAPAHVVGHDEDDVRTPLLGRRALTSNGEQQHHQKRKGNFHDAPHFQLQPDRPQPRACEISVATAPVRLHHTTGAANRQEIAARNGKSKRFAGEFDRNATTNRRAVIALPRPAFAGSRAAVRGSWGSGARCDSPVRPRW